MPNRESSPGKIPPGQRITAQEPSPIKKIVYRGASLLLAATAAFGLASCGSDECHRPIDQKKLEEIKKRSGLEAAAEATNMWGFVDQFGDVTPGGWSYEECMEDKERQKELKKASKNWLDSFVSWFTMGRK